MNPKQGFRKCLPYCSKQSNIPNNSRVQWYLATNQHLRGCLYIWEIIGDHKRDIRNDLIQTEKVEESAKANNHHKFHWDLIRRLISHINLRHDEYYTRRHNKTGCGIAVKSFGELLIIKAGQFKQYRCEFKPKCIWKGTKR